MSINPAPLLFVIISMMKIGKKWCWIKKEARFDWPLED